MLAMSCMQTQAAVSAAGLGSHASKKMAAPCRALARLKPPAGTGAYLDGCLHSQLLQAVGVLAAGIRADGAGEVLGAEAGAVVGWQQALPHLHMQAEEHTPRLRQTGTYCAARTSS